MNVVQPLFSLKPSQLSQPDVEPACEGVCDGAGSGEKPSRGFEANCDGVTGVKVLSRINGIFGQSPTFLRLSRGLRIKFLPRY